ncbi:MAG: hypothetical protein CSA22_04365 [Deltaproteobacteria bacterium]|nr:MAG: hypothetical protein CSA22_04365 [Deltaproteobacteria bacterium]
MSEDKIRLSEAEKYVMCTSEKVNILIVDDRKENLMALEKHLRRPGWHIIRATSGNDALAVTLEVDVALVLLDVQMPDMDGYETAEIIRNYEKTRHIPILFVTAINKESRHVFRGYEVGAVDYLFKPLNPDILISKVQIFVELYQQRRRLEIANRELKRANEQIIAQQKSVIEEERLKVLLQMAGATAHELNQPLMTLLSSIELVEMSEKDPEKMHRHILRIKEAGKRMSAIVDKIQTIRNGEVHKKDDIDWLANVNHRVRILMVDRSDADFDYVNRVLIDQTHVEIARATDIASAVEAIHNDRYDLVFSEHELPDGSGYDLLMRLAEFKETLPLVIITRHGNEMLATQMIQAGAYDYLPKDRLSAKVLMRVIVNTMEKKHLKEELKTAQSRMAEMSTIDDLTQLFNRRYLMDALEKEFERARRYKTELTLVMMDLDYFKNVNDTYGHPAGDMVLARVAAIIRSLKRFNDIACRYGGEEFSLLLPNTSLKRAFKACEKIRIQVAEELFDYEGSPFRVTISMGVASSKDSKTLFDLLSYADKALYRAKEAGRNRISADIGI